MSALGLPFDADYLVTDGAQATIRKWKWCVCALQGIKTEDEF